jgi:hypothetical protein
MSSSVVVGFHWRKLLLLRRSSAVPFGSGGTGIVGDGGLTIALTGVATGPGSWMRAMSRSTRFQASRTAWREYGWPLNVRPRSAAVRARAVQGALGAFMVGPRVAWFLYNHRANPDWPPRRFLASAWIRFSSAMPGPDLGLAEQMPEAAFCQRSGHGHVSKRRVFRQVRVRGDLSTGFLPTPRPMPFWLGRKRERSAR